MTPAQRQRLIYTLKSSTIFALAFFSALCAGFVYAMIAAAVTRSLGIENNATYGEPLWNGTFRFIATVIGFGLGLALVALFPQYVRFLKRIDIFFQMHGAISRIKECHKKLHFFNGV